MRNSPVGRARLPCRRVTGEVRYCKDVRIQMWSYNYAPEPQGIAPLSAIVANELMGMGHDVTVVAAHPHYPEPIWGTRLRPYREVRDGVPILRLPIWPGRGSGLQRIRQEVSFTISQSLVAPILPAADVVLAVTPSFPALAPAMAFAHARRIPWVMWLQDIVTDGAATTGELNEGALLRAARRFERRTYRDADRIVVISEAFRENLRSKGVADDKIVRIFNPSSRPKTRPNDLNALAAEPPRILAMGNIGHSQGLDGIVDAFQENEDLERMGARLVIAGGGVAAEALKARIKSERIEMPGVLYGEELDPVLRSTSLGLVSQRADITEFNLPSKLMHYMAYGLPVLASVRPGTETANIVEKANAGWVTDAADPAQFAATAARVLADREGLREAGRNAYEFASTEFDSAAVAARFEQVLLEVVARRRGTR